MMADILDNYKKFRWFFTSSGKLVAGGKNSKQNDELLNIIKSSGKEFIVMHTAQPGSPFAVILADADKTSKKDLEECAVFTACFSKAWKQRKNMAEVHIFNTKSLYKMRGMKEGTWGVKENIKKIRARLNLTLTRQNEVLRAVPDKNAPLIEGKRIRLSPGKIDKAQLAAKIKAVFGVSLDQQGLLSAVPAGGFKILR